MRRAGLALVVALELSAGCSSVAHHIIADQRALHELLGVPADQVLQCFDREPVRILTDRRCPGGVCGYSCLPGRWDPPGEW